MRICSLLPSGTEIVAELGLAESLVGISEERDWPPEVRRPSGRYRLACRNDAPDQPGNRQSGTRGGPVTEAPCTRSTARCSRHSSLI
jgi:hypothetical protein